MEEKRYIGLDYGGRRIGVAVSDPGGSLALSLDTLTVSGDNDAVRQLAKLIEEYQPVGIVIGLPLNLSGGESEVSGKVRHFADKLKEVFNLPVYLEDERLSSRLAESVLHSHGKKIKGHKEKIDRISAVLILQSFFDRSANKSNDTQSD
ncbi:MAG: Holliday junction resolvase RuvX [Candidatus Zixiibacteriota bacterium]|nr:MAG: Holliday junction resolvase RuvX [candidate division Zixibacteria bacterium]